MTINRCRACGSVAAIQYRRDDKARVFRVWVQCSQCGRKTRAFVDGKEPTTATAGGKFAAIAWNSGDIEQEARG